MKQKVLQLIGNVSTTTALSLGLIAPVAAQNTNPYAPLRTREINVTDILPNTLAEAANICEGDDNLQGLWSPEVEIDSEDYERRLVACILHNPDYTNNRGQDINHNGDYGAHRFLYDDTVNKSPALAVTETQENESFHLFWLETREDGETYLINVDSPAVVGNPNKSFDYNGQQGTYETPPMETRVDWVFKASESNLENYMQVGFLVLEEKFGERPFLTGNGSSDTGGVHDWFNISLLNKTTDNIFSRPNGERQLSHGCVRTPAEMQQLIQETLVPGSRVLITHQMPDEEIFVNAGSADELTGNWQPLPVTRDTNDLSQMIVHIPERVLSRSTQDVEAQMIEAEQYSRN